MKFKRPQLDVQWDKVSDIVLRVVIWLLLGSLINLIPILAAYLTKAGGESANGNYSLTSALSSGDLLLAATVMLPPALADLALNARRAKRTRAIIVILGALLSFFSLLLYGYAFANNLARASNKAAVAINLDQQSVASLSVGFFLGAVFLGAICAGFLAGDTSTSPSNSEATGTPNSNKEPTATSTTNKESE